MAKGECMPPFAIVHISLRRLQQMEMGRSTSSRAGISPFCDHLGIDGHFIEDRQQGDGGEFLEQMIADFPRAVCNWMKGRYSVI
jgi:hypothetical protein